MIVFPNAKINIGLNILRKRPDNYHDLETLFYPLQLSDILEINKAQKSTFATSGIEIDSDLSDNIVMKAYTLLKTDFSLPPVNIHLHKQIPSGAGLGGGSSDGAYTLMALNQLFHLNLNTDKLIEYAAKLGSDCPFFILNKPVFATGRGEIFSPSTLSLAGYKIVLVKPSNHVSTAEAYSNTKPRIAAKSLAEIIAGEKIESWKNTVFNQFEESIFPAHPEIKNIKKELYEAGALYASMSGSGSSVFGIFKPEAVIDHKFKSCFVHFETANH